MGNQNYRIIKRVIDETLVYVIVVFISYSSCDDDGTVQPGLAIAWEITAEKVLNLLDDAPIYLVVRHMQMYYRLTNFKQLRNIRAIVSNEEMKDIILWMDEQIEYYIYLLAPLDLSI